MVVHAQQGPRLTSYRGPGLSIKYRVRQDSKGLPRSIDAAERLRYRDRYRPGGTLFALQGTHLTRSQRIVEAQHNHSPRSWRQITNRDVSIVNQSSYRSHGRSTRSIDLVDLWNTDRSRHPERRQHGRPNFCCVTDS